MRALLLGVVLTASLPMVAQGQSLEQRINEIRRQRDSAANQEQASDRARRKQIAANMNATLPSVQLDTGLREAIQWWSVSSGVPVVINWNAMENDGVFPEADVQVDLSTVPAAQALSVILRTGAPDFEFVWEVEPGYIQVFTKEEANRMPVVGVFDVSDLLVEIPNFDDAPEFDLSDALESSSAGGGGGGGNGLFSEEDTAEERPMTKRERGEQLAQLVRDSIEPTIWDENGGGYGCNVRYWNGRLIVRAPKYVLRQIGQPAMVREVAPRARVER